MIQNISVLGGDLRYIKLIQMLKKDGLNISTFGIESKEIIDVCKYDSFIDFLKKNDFIIAPTPFSKDGVNINAPYSNKEIKIDDIIFEIKNKVLISGGIKENIINVLEKNNNKIIDLLKEEDLAILNTISTAEGALQIAMEQTETTIYNSNVLVLGFGRVGKTVADRFKAIKANVYCEARKDKDIAWIKTLGYKAIYIENLEKEIDKFDIIINTIPTIIIDKSLLKNIKKECLIIDLASTPGGVDINTANEMNIKCITALGLPGKVAPTTSAEFIKEVLYKKIKDINKENN